MVAHYINIRVFVLVRLGKRRERSAIHFQPKP